MEKRLFTCEEVAEYFNVKISTIWTWIRSGKLPCVKIGRQYRIEKEVLENFAVAK